MNFFYCLDDFMSMCFIFPHEELKPTALISFSIETITPMVKTGGRLCGRKRDDYMDQNTVPQAEDGDFFLVNDNVSITKYILGNYCSCLSI